MRPPIGGAALACLGLVTAAAACNFNDPTAETIAWETQLVAAISHPGLEGQAAVVSQLSGTDAGIGILGAEPDAMHTWRVRLSTCAAPGEAIGPQSDYPELVVDEGRDASAEAHLGPRLTRDSTYHVEVRQSATDTSRIACGDLQLQ